MRSSWIFVLNPCILDLSPHGHSLCLQSQEKKKTNPKPSWGLNVFFFLTHSWVIFIGVTQVPVTHLDPELLRAAEQSIP